MLANPVFSLNLCDNTFHGSVAAKSLMHDSHKALPGVRVRHVRGDDLVMSLKLVFEFVGRGSKLLHPLG